jgi:hypothetical protein
MIKPSGHKLEIRTFADRVNEFNRTLQLDIELPQDIRVMNPFQENPEAVRVSTEFYNKFYNDNQIRTLILGINPGRFGAGVTGIPFTDTRRLEEKCGIPIQNPTTHEPSSVFVYEVIEAFGGVKLFYGEFYINSICPLGFIKRNVNNREINYNYYDNKDLLNRVTPFAIESIRAHIAAGCQTDKAFCLGMGKNYIYLKFLNDKFHFFKSIVPLEHPRFIVQYKSKDKAMYIENYVRLLKG